MCDDNDIANIVMSTDSQNNSIDSGKDKINI